METTHHGVWSVGDGPWHNIGISEQNQLRRTSANPPPSEPWQTQMSAPPPSPMLQVLPALPVRRTGAAGAASPASTVQVPCDLFGADKVLKTQRNLLPGRNVSFRDRIACHEWTYFTMTMATGGIANVLHSLSHRATWVAIIGASFCLLNIILFCTNCALLLARFYMRPGSFSRSFTDQVESLFIPSFFVSIAVILINVCEYGVPHCGFWLLRAVEILYWIYLGVSVVASAGLYLILWSTLVFPVHTMTPIWVFPAYPLLLTAPFASNLISSADLSGNIQSLNVTAIALCATVTQGTGCLIALMISAAFIYRLMTQKLPQDAQRPGVFISIGPFGFTAAGVAQLGRQAAKIVPENFIETPITADIIRVVSILVALWLWGLCMWFFLVSIGSLGKYIRPGRRIPFQMTWWSFVFPNTALVVTTQVMGEIFKSNSIYILGVVMTVLLIIVWVSVMIAMCRALWVKTLLWPKEDIDSIVV